nr:DUF1194 domain-containing protein [Brevirhabdus pacifica]
MRAGVQTCQDGLRPRRRLIGLRAALSALFLALAVLGAATPAGAACRQALTLGLDVSGSVDAEEYAMQRDGLASALEDPRVAQALLAMPRAAISLSIFEWSGSEFQRVLVPWTALSDLPALASVVGQLRASRRVAAPSTTALGTAIAVGRAMLAQRGDCWRHTLDISGDGRSNEGPRPRDLLGTGAGPMVTVNALVIGEGGPDSGPAPGAGTGGPAAGGGTLAGTSGARPVDDLLTYFRAEVIEGPGAFAEPALGYGDYRDAMVRKLLREIRTLAVGDATTDLPVRAH